MIIYCESRRFVERDCISLEDGNVLIKLDFCDGNDETNLRIKITVKFC